MASIQAFDFIVKKNNLQETKIVERAFSRKLPSNQVLLKIDTFSLTSNNITYGIMGEQMNYWQFFPAETGYGIIPAWGFADVMVSNHLGVKVGQRFYGYYPIGTHLVVIPDKISPHGFVDSAEHRRALPLVYNFYTNTAQDPSITTKTEALVALFRPLFVTSFLIDYHLEAQNFFSASQILVTSASSKTAQALAFLLALRKKEPGLPLNLIGLTSKKNVPFVQQLGWYDKTICYEQCAELNSNEKIVVVDFTGNHHTQYQLQTTFGDNLVYNCLVGLADWQHLRGKQSLPNKGEFFFAPTHAEELQQALGVSRFQQKVGLAWQQFIGAIQSAISIKQYRGVQELEKLYSTMLNGNMDPKQGNMICLH